VFRKEWRFESSSGHHFVQFRLLILLYLLPKAFVELANNKLNTGAQFGTSTGIIAPYGAVE